MKQLICTILLLGCMHLTALTQEQEPPPTNDSTTLTTITTTDFMETISVGRLNWGSNYSVRSAAGRCFWGNCGPPRDGTDLWVPVCCSFREWFIKTFGGGGSGGNPTLITANGEDGGGAGGNGGGTIWIGTIFGGVTPYTPIQPSFGGGGGGTNNNNTGNIGTPPPIKPVFVLDDGSVDSSSMIPKDCAGVKNGTAYKDTCGYCVGGTTGKPPCVCPTDSNFTVTKEMLLHINPSGNKNRMDSVLKYINIYKNDPDFKVNTRLRLAHFLAQISAETDGFLDKHMSEDYSYSRKALLKKGKLFDSTNVDQYVNCLCVFDRMYCCNNENGNEASKDGSKYRGRGFNQMTWKENYRRFTQYYQTKFNDTTVNFVSNPDLLATNMKYSVIAAMWDFCKFKKLNPYADADNILAYSKGVNCGNANAKCKEPNGLKKRIAKLALAKQTLCL